MIVPGQAIEAYALPEAPGRIVVSGRLLDALDDRGRAALLAPPPGRQLAPPLGRQLAPPPGRQLALLAVATLLVLIAGVSAAEAARDLHALVEFAQSAR